MSRRSQRDSEQFGRRASPQNKLPMIILACEGLKSEPLYFTDLIRIERIQVNPVFPPHQGTDPLTVVMTAIEARKEKQRQKLWKPTSDQVWAIFDGNEHRDSPKKEEHWHRAIDLARRSDIKLAISNPSFEFWFLIHFADCFSATDRVNVIRRLETHVRDYEKSLPVYEKHLKSLTYAAIERAKRLTEIAVAKGKQPHENPCTGVGELVRILLGLR